MTNCDFARCIIITFECAWLMQEKELSKKQQAFDKTWIKQSNRWSKDLHLGAAGRQHRGQRRNSILILVCTALSLSMGSTMSCTAFDLLEVCSKRSTIERTSLSFVAQIDMGDRQKQCQVGEPNKGRAPLRAEPLKQAQLIRLRKKQQKFTGSWVLLLLLVFFIFSSGETALPWSKCTTMSETSNCHLSLIVVTSVIIKKNTMKNYDS